MKMVKYEGWKTEYYTMNSGFPMPTFTAQIGTDADGKAWFACVKFKPNSPQYELMFDYSEDGETPFLKDCVVYAQDYSGAIDKHYHRHFIKYDDFNRVVSDFMEEYGIN